MSECKFRCKTRGRTLNCRRGSRTFVLNNARASTTNVAFGTLKRGGLITECKTKGLSDHYILGGCISTK